MKALKLLFFVIIFGLLSIITGYKFFGNGMLP